jgi:demethylmenaquinone methyltransferase/2-methoxy-6-polyprenyl-1,4-benzoquinol methylase
MIKSPHKTHFGFQEIDTHQKADKVAQVFDGVASSYDLMNDLMSFGLHRLWKKQVIALAHLKIGHMVCDLAAGTGDLTIAIANKVSSKGFVIHSDINRSMLKVGRDRIMNTGNTNQVMSVQIDAQALPFEDNSLDRVFMGFGLRNVTDKQQALNEMQRVLKPGGIALVLEFSKPTGKLIQKIYDTYSFSILPKIGKIVAKNEAAYQYLAESIRMHPDQEALKLMMMQAGFDEVDYTNSSCGIVAIHRGFKF